MRIASCRRSAPWQVHRVDCSSPTYGVHNQRSLSVRHVAVKQINGSTQLLSKHAFLKSNPTAGGQPLLVRQGKRVYSVACSASARHKTVVQLIILEIYVWMLGDETSYATHYTHDSTSFLPSNSAVYQNSCSAIEGPNPHHASLTDQWRSTTPRSWCDLRTLLSCNSHGIYLVCGTPTTAGAGPILYFR